MLMADGGLPTAASQVPAALQALPRYRPCRVRDPAALETRVQAAPKPQPVSPARLLAQRPEPGIGRRDGFRPVAAPQDGSGGLAHGRVQDDRLGEPVRAGELQPLELPQRITAARLAVEQRRWRGGPG